MPIRANRAYNDPALGQAFSNLSALFGPPDPSETAAYAAARARNAEAAATEEEARRNAERYEWLANPVNQADPAYRQRAEGYFLGTGGRPDQSFYTVDQGNKTLRRGQDIESGDRRYGTDVGARTTLATNAADNSRAVQTNAADNQRGLLGTLFQPLNQGQIRPAVPAKIADLFALPPIEAAAGAEKPLSETEWQAGQNERLRQSGQLTDQQLVDTVLGQRSPVEAIGPGGSPVFMSPGQAVRTGAQPAPSKPLVSVNTGDAPDGKLRGKLDENEGARLSGLQASAVTASGLRQDLDLMGQLINEAPQGPLVGRLASIFPGISDAGAAFQSIVDRAAPGLRVEGSGATSDVEFKGMQNSLPQLRNRPEANRLIAETMRAKADINIKRGDIVTAYQNGEIDASQMRQRLAELNRVSIISPALRDMIQSVGGGVEPLSGQAAGAAAPSPGTIVDGHRFRGGDPSDPANWELL